MPTKNRSTSSCCVGVSKVGGKYRCWRVTGGAYLFSSIARWRHGRVSDKQIELNEEERRIYERLGPV